MCFYLWSPSPLHLPSSILQWNSTRSADPHIARQDKIQPSHVQYSRRSVAAASCPTESSFCPLIQNEADPARGG